MRAAKSKNCGGWIKSFVLFACVYALGGQARADLNVYSTGFEQGEGYDILKDFPGQ